MCSTKQTFLLTPMRLLSSFFTGSGYILTPDNKCWTVCGSVFQCNLNTSIKNQTIQNILLWMRSWMFRRWRFFINKWTFFKHPNHDLVVDVINVYRWTTELCWVGESECRRDGPMITNPAEKSLFCPIMWDLWILGPRLIYSPGDMHIYASEDF